MDDDAQEVIRRELELLERSVRRDPAAVRAWLHPAFREIGASGRIWNVDEILEQLAAAGDETAAEAHDLEPTRLADDLVLLTYRAERPERRSLRSSLWQRVDGEWLMRFHQGTPVPPLVEPGPP